MKLRLQMLALVLLIVLLSGCRTAGSEPEVTEATPDAPLQIDALTVELSRSGVDTQQLIRAVKELPDVLKAYFDETEAEIGSVNVTVGASPADTAAALEQGNIQLAFLPVEGFLPDETGQIVLLSDEGTSALICAAPTTYGARLSDRISGGGTLTRMELKNARWGVLNGESLDGFRRFDLWLSDEYEGDRASELPAVTEYGSGAAILSAAARGEIDALVCGKDEYAAEPELFVLAETEVIYHRLAVVTAKQPELADGRFAAALEYVLERLAGEQPELATALGATHFVPVESDDALDATRRLMTMEG